MSSWKGKALDGYLLCELEKGERKGMRKRTDELKEMEEQNSIAGRSKEGEKEKERCYGSSLYSQSATVLPTKP